MKLLLHICCAPCSIACIQSLRAEGIEPTGFWYNPNIHPLTEYRARRDALQSYAAQIGMALEMHDAYGLRPFVRAVAEDIDARCVTCYAARMRETARYARAHGFTHFTSTLFVSPYQDHALLRAAAEQAAAEFGVAFLYRDFRPGFRDGQAQARALALYMQKYCGCVFSEEERYTKRSGAKPAAKPAEKPPALFTEAEAALARQAAMPLFQAAGLRFDAEQAKADAAPPTAAAQALAAAMERERTGAVGGGDVRGGDLRGVAPHPTRGQ